MARWLLVYGTVFVASAIPTLEILFVIPAGILAGLAPVPTALVAAIGNFTTVVPVIVGGDRVRRWWAARRGHDVDGVGSTQRRERARRVMRRFGVPGLALLGPLLTGVHVAAFGAVAAGARRGVTLAWFAASLVAWSAVIALLTAQGLDVVADPDSLPQILDATARP